MFPCGFQKTKEETLNGVGVSGNYKLARNCNKFWTFASGIKWPLLKLKNWHNFEFLRKKWNFQIWTQDYQIIGHLNIAKFHDFHFWTQKLRFSIFEPGLAFSRPPSPRRTPFMFLEHFFFFCLLMFIHSKVLSLKMKTKSCVWGMVTKTLGASAKFFRLQRKKNTSCSFCFLLMLFFLFPNPLVFLFIYKIFAVVSWLWA